MTKAAQISTWTIAALIATVLGFAAACGSSKKLGGGGSNSKKPTKGVTADVTGDEIENEDEDEEKEKDPETPVTPVEEKQTLDLNKVGSVVGFKENDALIATFAALTKVSRAEVLESIRLSNPTTPQNQQTPAAAQAKFDGYFSQLATGEAPSQQTPAVVAATTKLAAHYCDALTINATLRGSVLAGIDFAAAPATLDMNKVSEALIKAFWPMGIESAPDMAKSISDLAAALTEIRSLAPTATTPSLVMGGCTITLTSAPVTML